MHNESSDGNLKVFSKDEIFYNCLKILVQRSMMRLLPSKELQQDSPKMSLQIDSLQKKPLVVKASTSPSFHHGLY